MSALLTTGEAAAILRLHEKTVRRMILRGELRAAYVGRKYLIDRADLPLDPIEPRPRPARPRPVRPAKQGGRFSQIAREMDAA